MTQIVRAGEIDIFHTRQQHTYKVAQIGRRLAQKCCSEQADLCSHYGVDPEVVEAACMAHDLGHPPFGHIGEHALDELVRNIRGNAAYDGEDDGYEGNAQTFRILTKLSVRFGENECNGLDLSRATLAAVLKYPWFRDLQSDKKKGKWSAYKSEEKDFIFAREFHAESEEKTAEAEIVDWADDIAYSVHDLEDFHRVGVIPWNEILDITNEAEIVNRVAEKWFDAPTDAPAQIREALKSLRGLGILFPAVINQTYDGSREQRRQLRNLTSRLVGNFIRALKLAEPGSDKAVDIDTKSSVLVRLLKFIARKYVIDLPALSAQQYGQKRLIEQLFDAIVTETDDGPPKFLPMRLRYMWNKDVSKARFAADCISSLTENEAYKFHQRLVGIDSGTVLDPIVR